MPKHVPPPELVAAQGDWVTIPLAKLEDGNLHRLALPMGNKLVRFLAIKTQDGKVRTALDACEICGAFGYIQENNQLICLNCEAEINPNTVGIGGGCNPIPVKSEVAGGELRIAREPLQQSTHLFTEQASMEQTCAVCGMKFKISETSAFESYNGKTYYLCPMENCRKLFKQNPSAYVK